MTKRNQNRYLTTEEMAAIVEMNRTAPVAGLGNRECSINEALAHVNKAVAWKAAK